MPITDIPILSMLRTKMEWHQERQKVLAENIANSDTPGFRARDLEAPNFDKRNTPPPAVGLSRTASTHIGGIGQDQGSPQFRTATDRKVQVRPGGNSVSLEDEIMRVSSNQMDYQAATALYQRSLGLIKTALGKR